MINNAFYYGCRLWHWQTTAEALYAPAGWSLALADLDETGLNQLIQEWDKGRVRCYPLDVRDFRALKQPCKTLPNRDKRLQVLVNCAGVLQVGKVDSIGIERHQQILISTCKARSMRALPRAYFASHPAKRWSSI